MREVTMRISFAKPAYWFILFTIVMLHIPIPGKVQAQEEARQVQFQKSKGITIQVFKSQTFEQKFSGNPLIPRTKEDIISLAKRLYTPATREEILEECAESLYGALFASLANPEITDETRNEVDNIIDLNTPSLPETYTEGHFKFLYTTNNTNTDHNVTLNEIKETAKVLNAAWDDYAANFTTPKHYLSGSGCDKKRMIDVKVYYLGSNLYGSTGSSLDYIELNSKKVVKDNCRRQTTPVHELFHRVQYSYGYISGTAKLKWAVEGTAAWSQKYRAPNVGDWMDRMDQGLSDPDLDLIADRSYNACHFWCYLGQSGQGEMPTIKLVWSTFNTNGNNMVNAVVTAIQNRVPNGATLDQFAGWWSFANYYKDVSNASASFDYEEDEWIRTCNSTTHGPLVSVPHTANTLNVGSNHTINGSVASYGADYYVFSIGSNVQNVQINVAASTNNFGYAVIELNNNTMVTYQRTPAGGWSNYQFSKTISPGSLSHITLVVIGNPNGGNYTVTASGS